MYRANSVVPRLCRQLQTLVRQPLRCQSNYPVHSWFGMRANKTPCDLHLNRRHAFDKHFRSILEEMNQMTRHAFDEIVEGIPRRGRHVLSRSEAVELKFDDKAFSLKMNMRDFEQEHVKLKINNNRLVISAKHEKPGGNGCVSREMTREFLIPENIDVESMNAIVTDDGLLVVNGRVKGVTEEMEKVIEIQRESSS
ncbi:alpha-crystallin A chain-like [Pecten maximus]|uniref:alpha-crystallin A chain-like n=1 Tax=Pecten maximus TaxID=6579 RepID=UPI001458C169|nr:alpha-crystallin A chain-like [Pecten maximus]